MRTREEGLAKRVTCGDGCVIPAGRSRCGSHAAALDLCSQARTHQVPACSTPCPESHIRPALNPAGPRSRNKCDLRVARCVPGCEGLAKRATCGQRGACPGGGPCEESDVRGQKQGGGKAGWLGIKAAAQQENGKGSKPGSRKQSSRKAGWLGTKEAGKRGRCFKQGVEHAGA